MIEYDVLFCFVHDFCKAFVQWWQKMLLQGDGERKKRNRSTRLHLSEIITIMLAYHESGYRCQHWLKVDTVFEESNVFTSFYKRERFQFFNDASFDVSCKSIVKVIQFFNSWKSR